MSRLSRWGLGVFALGGVALVGCGSTNHPPGTKPGPDGKVPLSAAKAEGARTDIKPNGPKIAALAMSTSVYERPDHGSKPIGFLRLGEAVARTEKPVAGDKCDGGWYGVLPQGFVCAGEDATLDLGHKVIRALAVKPDLSKPMPYTYGFVRANATLYHQVPSFKDQEHWEFAVRGHIQSYEHHKTKWNEIEKAGANHVPLDDGGNAKTLPKDEMPVPAQPDDDNLFGNLEDGETPWWLRGRRQIPNISTFKAPEYAIFAGRVYRHAGLAVIGSFKADEKAGGRKFTVLLDGRIIGEDKIKPHYASQFHGIALDGSLPFPFAIVRREDATSFEPNETAKWKKGPRAVYRDIVPLTGEVKKFNSTKYYETKDGRWLRYDQISVFSEPELPKHFDAKATKWIDVSIWQQTLVMYEGEKPVYATLVSTGVDGMGDPETTKSTIRGEFKIDVKHVTATMDADDPESRFELRDVPWVQYFERGYALHAAYWHDDFGRPRSHGCINLAPIDARKLFFWTDPGLPEHFHAVRAGEAMGPGTWVRVRGLAPRRGPSVRLFDGVAEGTAQRKGECGTGRRGIGDMAKSPSSGRAGGAILSTGTTVRGRVTGEGDLTIDGHVEGEVSVRGRVVVSEGATVSGDALSGIDVEIAGEVSADVSADGALVVSSSAVVRGGLRGKTLHIHEGASIAADFDGEFELPEELRGRAR